MNNLALTPAEQNEVNIIDLIRNIKVNFLEVGSLLAENYDKGYWSQNYNSFKDFVEMLGVGSYSWVTRLIGIARVVAHNTLTEDEVLEIGVAKTCLLLPRLKDGKVDTDTIELAKSCPYYDLRIKLGLAKDDDEMSEEYLLCPRCGAQIIFHKEMLRR